MRHLVSLLALAAPVLGCQTISYSGDPDKLARIQLEQYEPAADCGGKGILMLSVRPNPGGRYRSIQQPMFFLRPGHYRFCYMAEREYGTPGSCLHEMEAGFDTCGSEMVVEVSAGRTYLLRASTMGAELVAL